MYAIIGITGRVGGIVARTLLDTGLSVRAVVRDATKGVAWKERGSEVALADMNDASALTAGRRAELSAAARQARANGRDG